jgi:hypothetical protein
MNRRPRRALSHPAIEKASAMIARALKIIGQSLLRMTGQKARPAEGVIVHDPAADAPHDLDDPFYDPDVQARVGETIAGAMRKK